MAKQELVFSIPDESTLHKVIITNRKEFKAIKAYLIDSKIFFWYTSQGSVNTIIWNNKEYISVDLTQSGGRGHHLNKIFRKDIDSWLETNANLLTPRSRDYKEQMINLEAIEQALGQQLIAIDINDCYWKTTFRLSYMTEKTYISGLRKREWKDGRNACVGSLRKTKTMIPYIDGMADYKLRPAPIKQPIEYEWIRNHIIGSVYDMFFRLYQEIGNSFYMYLTDCVFTDYKSKKYVEDFFTKYGYKVKCKSVEFTKVDRKNKKIFWHDFQAPKRDSSGDIIGKGADKYYYYSNHQLIGGVVEKSISDNYDFMHQNK